MAAVISFVYSMLKFKILTAEKQYTTAACCLITDFEPFKF
jgi:hypothetical protein